MNEITFLVWRKEQESDWNHFCDLAQEQKSDSTSWTWHTAKKKKIQVTFFGFAERWRTKVIQITLANWHTSLCWLGAKKHESD